MFMMHYRCVPRMPQRSWNVSSIVVSDTITMEASSILSHMRPEFVFIPPERQRRVAAERYLKCG